MYFTSVVALPYTYPTSLRFLLQLLPGRNVSRALTEAISNDLLVYGATLVLNNDCVLLTGPLLLELHFELGVDKILKEVLSLFIRTIHSVQ